MSDFNLIRDVSTFFTIVSAIAGLYKLIRRGYAKKDQIIADLKDEIIRLYEVNHHPKE